MEYRIITFENIADPSDVDLEHVESAEAGWFDGYGVGDRQLEGVMIKVILSEDKKGLQLVFDGWPPQVRQQYYAKDLLEYAYKNDFFSSTEDGDDDMIMIIKREDETKPWRYNYEE